MEAKNDSDSEYSAEHRVDRKDFVSVAAAKRGITRAEMVEVINETLHESMRKRHKENPEKFIPDGTPFEINTCSDRVLRPFITSGAFERIAREIVCYVQAVDCGIITFEEGILPELSKTRHGLVNLQDENSSENNGFIEVSCYWKKYNLDAELRFNEEEYNLLMKHGVIKELYVSYYF